MNMGMNMDKTVDENVVTPKMRILMFLGTNFSFILIMIMMIIFLITLFFFLRSKTLHKNHKFNVLLDLVSSLGATALAMTLFLTIFYRQQDKAEVSFQNYNTIWSKQTEFTMLFIDHPEMEYFHNDLNGIPPLTKNYHYKRNIVLERNFFLILMDIIITIIAYFDASDGDYSYSKMEIRSRFDSLMKMYVKSKLFLEHWYRYKKYEASPRVIEYMKKNYNI